MAEEYVANGAPVGLEAGFTDEERSFVTMQAAQPEPGSALMRLVSYSAFFLPGILIGIYALAVQSFQAMAIAFLIVVTNLFWSLGGVFREQRSLLLAYSVFQKLHMALTARR